MHKQESNFCLQAELSFFSEFFFVSICNILLVSIFDTLFINIGDLLEATFLIRQYHLVGCILVFMYLLQDPFLVIYSLLINCLVFLGQRNTLRHSKEVSQEISFSTIFTMARTRRFKFLINRIEWHVFGFLREVYWSSIEYISICVLH